MVRSGAAIDGRGMGRGVGRARGTARILPLLTLAAWVVTIWVPILDSASNSLHTGESMRIVITSLGRSPFEPNEAEPQFVIIWGCLLACVSTAWLVDGLRLWSWATAGFGSVMLIFLAGEIADPRIIMWDGRDSEGQWIGGMEVASPAPGAALWTIGGVALIAAGICGLIGERRRCSDRPGRGTGENNCPRISRWFSTVPGRDGRIRGRRYSYAQPLPGSSIHRSGGQFSCSSRWK